MFLERARASTAGSPSGRRTGARCGAPSASTACRPEYIVAIIGVETYYGRNMGRWRVIDALSTLAFDYPPRAPPSSAASSSSTCCSRARAASTSSRCAARTPARSACRSSCRAACARYAVDFDGDGAIDLQRARAPTRSAASPTSSRSTAGSAGEPVLLPRESTGEAWRPLRRRLGRAQAPRSRDMMRRASSSIAAPPTRRTRSACWCALGERASASACRTSTSSRDTTAARSTPPRSADLRGARSRDALREPASSAADRRRPSPCGSGSAASAGRRRTSRARRSSGRARRSAAPSPGCRGCARRR